jgi:hypothetical protein
MSVISGSIILKSTIVETLADDATRTETEAVSFGTTKTTTYTDGTTAGKCNRVYYREFTATATPYVLNLSTIVCNDGSVGMPYVRDGLVIHAGTVDGQNLTYGGGTTPFVPELGGTSPTETIQAGTAKRLFSKPLGATGHAVGANVNFRLDPGSATISGTILILGHS